MLSVISCQERMSPWGPSSQYGSIVLNLNSDDGLSLKTKTEQEEKAKGTRFSNVLVILTDNSNKVVGKAYETVSPDPVTQKQITFNNLLPGHYTAYAYANIDQYVWQNGTISDQEGSVDVGDDFSDCLDRQLLSFSNDPSDASAPENPSGVSLLLLTGQKIIEVGTSSTVTETLELKRPVVRLKVTINNTTQYPVIVNNISFSNFNPDKAYLLEHDSNGDGIPDVPTGTVYRELPAYNTLSPQSVSAGTEGIVYSTYLYENVSTNDYKIFATLTLQRSPDNLELSLGERPLGVIDYNTLIHMDEGESIDVLLINPRNSTRSGRLYYGIGPNGGRAPHGIAWESCGYNSFNKFIQRAKAIYSQKSSFYYQDFKYSGLNKNKSGLAGWSGDDNEDPILFNETDNRMYFNYENKRTTYFHTLTKNNGHFSIDRLIVNSGNDVMPLTSMTVIPGTKAGGKFPDDLNVNYLVEFKNSSNQSLKSDCFWESGDVIDNAKRSKLIWEDRNNNSTQDYQFILFGKFDSTGGLLKRILKGNNKEVPLTYMSRNEDINVVINVFYAEQDGVLSFEVDNSYWTDEGAIQPEHIFR